MESPRKNNDCYFYYYSTCLKGDGCLFRHEPSALGCETVCTFWQQGKCLNQHCNFRHMELRKNRKIIPCYWENQPGGCRKPHCSFLHKLPREPIGGDLEKAKECDNVAAGKPLDRPEWQRRTVLTEGAQFEECVGSSENDSTRVGPRRVSQSSEASYGSPPVDPLVVNFEEESDNESVPTSTPTKKPQRNIHVKTLEEIRLERIQAESAAFYSYDNDSEQISSKDLRSWIDTRKMYQKPVQDFKVLSLEEIRKIRFAQENGINIRDGLVQNQHVSSHLQVENKFYSGMDSENNNGVEYFLGVGEMKSESEDNNHSTGLVARIKTEVEDENMASGVIGNLKSEGNEIDYATNGSSEFLSMVEGDVGKLHMNHSHRPSLKRSHSPITFNSPKRLASEIFVKSEERSSCVLEEDKVTLEENCEPMRTSALKPFMEVSQPPKRVIKLVRRTQECERPPRRRLRRGNLTSITNSSDVVHLGSEVSFQVPLVDKVDIAAASVNSETISSDSQLVADHLRDRELSLHPEPAEMDRSKRCSIESVEEMFLDVHDTGMTLDADENILQDIDDLLKD